MSWKRLIIIIIFMIGIIACESSNEQNEQALDYTIKLDVVTHYTGTVNLTGRKLVLLLFPGWEIKGNRE